MYALFSGIRRIAECVGLSYELLSFFDANIETTESFIKSILINKQPVAKI